MLRHFVFTILKFTIIGFSLPKQSLLRFADSSEVVQDLSSAAPDSSARVSPYNATFAPQQIRTMASEINFKQTFPNINKMKKMRKIGNAKERCKKDKRNFSPKKRNSTEMETKKRSWMKAQKRNNSSLKSNSNSYTTPNFIDSGVNISKENRLPPDNDSSAIDYQLMDTIEPVTAHYRDNETVTKTTAQTKITAKTKNTAKTKITAKTKTTARAKTTAKTKTTRTKTTANTEATARPNDWKTETSTSPMDNLFESTGHVSLETRGKEDSDGSTRPVLFEILTSNNFYRSGNITIQNILGRLPIASNETSMPENKEIFGYTEISTIEPTNDSITKSLDTSSAELSSVGPSNAEPSSAGPSSAEPSSAGPSRAEPSNAGPSSAEPSSAGPISTGSSSLGPIRAGSSSAEPSNAGLLIDDHIPSFVERLNSLWDDDVSDDDDNDDVVVVHTSPPPVTEMATARLLSAREHALMLHQREYFEFHFRGVVLKDKLFVLIPVFCGMGGAMLLVLAAYFLRNCPNNLRHTMASLASRWKSDLNLLTDASSEDERG